jgi:hypothetical protein
LELLSEPSQCVAATVVTEALPQQVTVGAVQEVEALAQVTFTLFTLS